MKKKILALLFSLVGGLAFGQTISNKTGNPNTVDGQNLGNTTVYTMPQIQSTPLGTPTPQTSSWMSLTGAQALQVEFSSNTFNGSYSVQVSNNPTPVSTPGTNIFTVVRDKADYTTQGGQSFGWSYFITKGWKYFRLCCEEIAI